MCLRSEVKKYKCSLHLIGHEGDKRRMEKRQCEFLLELGWEGSKHVHSVDDSWPTSAQVNHLPDLVAGSALPSHASFRNLDS